MGLFHKHTHSDDPEERAAKEREFMDEYFREELRNHGRWYFEKVISENGVLFKQDLDATIEQINVELKDHTIKQLDETIAKANVELHDHVTQQLDAKFLEYGTAIKDAQDAALQSLTKTADMMQEQQKQLSADLEKSIADQSARVESINQAQDTALKALTSSAEAMQAQYEQLTTTLQQSIADQKAMMVKAFEENMATVIEHYLLGALGDQYDLKSQVPSIIQQMEANKQAIVDDMKL